MSDNQSSEIAIFQSYTQADDFLRRVWKIFLHDRKNVFDQIAFNMKPPYSWNCTRRVFNKWTLLQIHELLAKTKPLESFHDPTAWPTLAVVADQPLRIGGLSYWCAIDYVSTLSYSFRYTIKPLMTEENLTKLSAGEKLKDEFDEHDLIEFQRLIELIDSGEYDWTTFFQIYERLIETYLPNRVADLSHALAVLGRECARLINESITREKFTADDLKIEGRPVFSNWQRDMLQKSTSHQSKPEMPKIKQRLACGVDGHTLRWNDEEFTFTAKQAVVVRMLFEHLENGTPEVGGTALLDAVDHTAPPKKLSVLFKEHPAWNRIIVEGERRGTFRIKEPDG